MPYTMEDFQREIKEEVLKNLTEEDIDRILEGLSVEERLEGLSLEERLRGLEPEEIKEIEDYLEKIKGIHVKS